MSNPPNQFSEPQGTYYTLIQNAQNGDLTSARDLIADLSQCLFQGQAIPSELAAYFAPIFLDIAENPHNAVSSLHLSRRGRPPLDEEKIFSLIHAVISLKRQGLTHEQAFLRLSEVRLPVPTPYEAQFEPPPESGVENTSPSLPTTPQPIPMWQLSFERIRELFYAYVHDYAPSIDPLYYRRQYGEK